MSLSSYGIAIWAGALLVLADGITEYFAPKWKHANSKSIILIIIAVILFAVALVVK